jgi:uncharacterized damage-inducible protein DinB
MLAWVSEESFQGHDPQSLLANIHDLRDEDWTTPPPAGERTIADILEHVAWSKWTYADYAFGAAIPRPRSGRTRTNAEILAWLNEGHQHWLAGIRALDDDAELDRERLVFWGAHLPTRAIIRILIAHDLYHAGEINHLRALLQGTDRWQYE